MVQQSEGEREKFLTKNLAVTQSLTKWRGLNPASHEKVSGLGLRVVLGSLPSGSLYRGVYSQRISIHHFTHIRLFSSLSLPCLPKMLDK